MYTVDVFRPYGEQGSVFVKPYGLALFFLHWMSMCKHAMGTIYIYIQLSVWLWMVSKCLGRVQEPTSNKNNNSSNNNADTDFQLDNFLSHSCSNVFVLFERMCVRKLSDVYRNAVCELFGVRRAWKIHSLKSAVSLCCYFHTCASVSCVLWTE